MIKRQTFWRALVLLLGCQTVVLSEQTVFESTLLQNFRFGFESYAKDHGGYFPSNWSQVGEIYNLDKINRQYARIPQSFPIQNNYVFVTNRIPMTPAWKGDVLLIRHAAITNEENFAGRGIISVGPDGPVYTWLSEQDVQSMFQRVGVRQLPKPQTVSTPPDELAELEAAAEQTAREIEAQERDARRRPRPRFLGQTQDQKPLEVESARSSSANTPMAEAAPGMSAAPWLAIAVLALGGGLLVFLLWKASHSKPKGP